MSWTDGADLAQNIYRIFDKSIQHLSRVEQKFMAQAVIHEFESYGCDNMNQTFWWDLAGYQHD